MTTCLTCKFLREPDEPHKWHECLWKGPMARAIEVTCAVVNIQDPFTDCPVHEARAWSGAYTMAIYATVASLYFRRDRLKPYQEAETLGEWVARQDFPVQKEVADELIKEHNYEISHHQFGIAVNAYLAGSKAPSGVSL